MDRCPQGHEFTPENTIPGKRSSVTGKVRGRRCRICKNAQQLASYHRKHERHKATYTSMPRAKRQLAVGDLAINHHLNARAIAERLGVDPQLVRADLRDMEIRS